MHLIIAFITAIASLLYALDRLGIDIGWFNPWTWRRRRRWLKQYHANPAFNLDNPMDALALLLTAVAKAEGDVSREEKDELRRIFEDTFKQTAKEAADLLIASTHLLGSGEEVLSRPKDVLEKSLARFSPEQKASAMELLERIASVGGAASEVQRDFIGRVAMELTGGEKRQGW